MASPARLAEWIGLFMTGLFALGAVFFRRKYAATSPGQAGRVLLGVLAVICLLLFIWFLAGLLFA